MSFPKLTAVKPFGRLLLCAILLAALGARAATAGERSDPDRLNHPLLVGTATDSYPRSYLTPNGRCEGFSVDLLDAVARAMDLKIQRVKAPSSELEKRFREGEFDLLQAFTPGPGRETFADFSQPTIWLHGCIFVRADSDLNSVRDLGRAAMLVVGRNSAADQLLQDRQITPKSITYCSSVEEALQMINNGDFDAVFASRLSGLSVTKRDRLRNVRALPEALVGYDIRPCFAVHKGDQVLLARLDEGLAVLHRTGEYGTIYDQWFGSLEGTRITQQTLIVYVAPALTIALAIALLGLLRQRSLSQRIARQAARLAENEALLAEAQRIAHVGHWRYNVATRDLSCSAEMLRVLERDPKRNNPTYQQLLRTVSRSDRAIVHRAVRDALRGGIGSELTFSIRPRFDLKRVVHVNIQGVRGASGSIQAIVGTIQDITEQKLVENDLRAREHLVRAIYDNIPTALGVIELVDDTLRFISANPGTARILALEPQAEIAGHLLTDLGLPKEVIDFWMQWFKRCIAGGEILTAEPSVYKGTRHLSFTLVPLGQGPNGGPQVCYLAEDVTERKQMDAEMAQGRRLRAVGELVGGIAHEFNNLLTPILLKAELLATEWKNEPRLFEELRSISRAAQRGADLTKRLLAFGRRSEPKQENIKLHALVRANTDLVRPTIDRRIQLISNVPETLPSLYLNASDVHQIVLNLLLNARDTLVEKLNLPNVPENWRATITIDAAEFGPRAIENTHWEKTESPDGWISLAIRDNGMGMPQDVQERIFEPFYTTKGVGKGTGLGLATVWHLVTRMGGKVNVHSQPGEGTVFQVWLPILHGPIPEAGGPAQKALTDHTARICLVEDDDMVAQTLIATLRRTQHRVVHFRHGTEAWKHLSMHPADYDLLLLDLDLPGMSGLEIARRARAGRFKGKILVASGRLTERESQELDKLGVEFQIEKPFSAEKLNLAVQTCLNAHRPAGVL
ncbi:hypothetical protein DB347_03160 [Opitutaceae bacterium EW11]|nr:hypothetical protein DB347_03160 [Opitutaceae bacterium EW11]